MATSDVIIPEISVEFDEIEEKNKTKTEPLENNVSDIIEDPSLDILAKTGFNYEDAITQIDEKYKDLQERIDEPGLFMGTGEDMELQLKKNKEIIQAKMNYLSSTIGAPVENRPKIGFWMQALLQRFKQPGTRQKAFMEFFPEGNYQQVPLINKDGEKQLVEIYRRNPEEAYGLVYPFGRDKGEFGVVASEMVSAQTIAATAFALTKKPALGAMIGDYIGVKADKLINWAAGQAMDVEGGLGEDEFAGMDSIFDMKPTELLPFVGPGWADAFTSIAVGSITKGIGMGTNFITGQSHPTLIPIAESAMKAAHELGLPPVLMAQGAVNPAVRGMFFQAAEFTKHGQVKLIPQKVELFAKFKSFGVSEKAKKAVKEIDELIEAQYQKGKFGEVGTLDAIGEKLAKRNKLINEIDVGNSISWDDWSAVLDWKKSQLADAMTPYLSGQTGKFVTPSEGFEGLQKAFQDWEALATAGNDKLRKTVVNNSTGVSYTIGGNNGLKQLITEFETGTGNFFGKQPGATFGTTTSNVFKRGKAIEETVPILLKKYPKLDTLIKNIKELDDVIINVGGKVPAQVKSKVKSIIGKKYESGSFKAFDQMEALRSDAFEIMSNTTNKRVRDAAEQIHKKISSMMDDSTGEFLNGGGPKFRKALSAYLQDTLEMEKITGMKNMVQAMDDGINPQDFASRFFIPGSSYDIVSLSSKMGGFDKAGQHLNVNFNSYIKSFHGQLLRDPKKIREVIESWQKIDPEGLEILLRPDQIEDLLNLGDTAVNMGNSVVQKAFTNQSQNTIANAKEVLKEVIGLAKAKKIGNAKAIEEFIKDSGGIDSKIIENMRSGIIQDILDQASYIDDITNTPAVNPKALVKLIDNLAKDTHLNMLFPQASLDVLRNFSLYTNVIGASGDIGGKMAVGAFRQAIANTLVAPGTAPSVLKTWITNDITARILGRGLTMNRWNQMLKVDLANSPNYKMIRAVLAEINAEFLNDGYQKQDILEKGNINASDVITSYPGQEFMPSNPESNFAITNAKIKGMQDAEEAQEILKESQVNQQSSLANPNLGFRSVGAGSADPNTYAQGQQLFGNNPREITFAAQGGIMNTRTAFQRVA